MLHFLLKEPKEDELRVERMWVEIIKQKSLLGKYTGVLTNQPKLIIDLNAGDEIEFYPKHFARVIVEKDDPKWIDSYYVMPHGNGFHYMVVNKSIRDSIGVTQGDEVTVTMEIDLDPRTVTVPEDFQRLLDEYPAARIKFEGFSYSHKKEWIDWINEAKREETRVNRINKAMSELLGK
jgi:hypothetical protein